MSKLLIYWISLLLIFTACSNQKNKSGTVPPTVTKNVEQESVIETGSTYSDSMISARVISALTPPPAPIDTMATLSEANCISTAIGGRSFLINEEKIAEYDSLLAKVSPSIKQLLNVTHCYDKIFENDDYKINVYYNQQYESHYSASFELIGINKKTYEISRLVLARLYGNEQGDEIISSVIDENNLIKRKIQNIHRYIHGIGIVDSSSIREEKFIINQFGKFIRNVD